MNIFQKFFQKKQHLNTPHSTTIRCNYTCEDADLEWIIKAYLNGTRTAIDCLQDFLNLMAYRDCLHLIENEAIFSLLEDFLEDATWKNEWTEDCGDYNPAHPDSWLRCIYAPYKNMLFDIEAAETLLQYQDKKITTSAIMEIIDNPLITPEIYENKNLLISKRDSIKNIISKEEFSPKEILFLIKDNWNLLYHYRSTYEALEYCIACSENHTIPQYFDCAFRDFGYILGTLYRKAKEA